MLEPAWCFHLDSSKYYCYWNEEADGVRTVTYLTDLFRNPSFLMDHYDRPELFTVPFPVLRHARLQDAHAHRVTGGFA